MTKPTRRSMRHDIIADTILHVADAPPLAVTICNISRHGLVIDSLAALSEDDIIHVELEAGNLRPARFVWQDGFRTGRSEEHTSELQSLMRISYAVFCLKKKT